MIGSDFLSVDEKLILPELLASQESNVAIFARNFARGRFVHSGWTWVDSLPLASWSPHRAGWILRVLPFEPRTWDIASQLGEETKAFYWSGVQIHGTDLSVEEIGRATESLLEANRALSAIELLGMALHQQKHVPSSIVIQTLEANIKPRPDGRDSERMDSCTEYEIQQLFEALQQDPDVEEPRLLRLECAYFSVFDQSGTVPKTLHAALVREPEFFAQLLELAYPLEHEPTEQDTEPDKVKEHRARNAFGLLKSLRTVPGTVSDGSIDLALLLRWIRKARETSVAEGRQEVCDSLIGEILAHAPFDTDESWPCRPVRDAMEEIDSEELFNGFEVGVLNKRGVTSRTLREGGDQERELAGQFRRYADACAVEWPKTAASLRHIAEGYDWWAIREDERAASY